MYYRLRNLFYIFLAIILSPFVYPLIWQRKKRSLAGAPLRILVIPQLTRIGDLVCSTPVFRAIKKEHPACWLAVLTTNKAIGIIKNNPRIDEFIIYEHNDFYGTVRKIREKNFNWSLCLSGTAVGTLLVFLGLVVNRLKLTRAGRPLSEVLTDRLCNFRFFYEHHTFLPGFYLKMLAPLRIFSAEIKKEVFPTAAGEEKADKFFAAGNIDAAGNLIIGISVTAGNKIKEWGDEKFSELAGICAEKYGAKIIFLGGKNDSARIDNILAKANNGNFFKAVDFSLEDLPALIKKLKLYIAVDTGPIYIAHALGIPLIDITGPCDTREQPPQDEKSIIVAPPEYIPPSSFVFKKSGRPEEHARALNAISVAEVMRAVEKMAKSNW